MSRLSEALILCKLEEGRGRHLRPVIPRAPLQVLFDPAPKLGDTHTERTAGFAGRRPILDTKGPPGKEGSLSKGYEDSSLP